MAITLAVGVAASEFAAPPADSGAQTQVQVWTHSRSVMPGVPAQLAAVLASDDPRFSRAVFVAGDGRQMTYAVGDTVAPGVVLDAIERDYVVLNRGGRAEAMRLRHGSPVPETLALLNPKPIKPPADPYGAVANMESSSYGGPSVAERLAAMRAAVPATPAPLPPTSTSRFDPQRGKDSPKLAPVPVEIKD